MAQIHNIVSGLLAIVLTRCPRHYEVNSYGDKNRVTVDYPVNVHGVQQYRMDGGHYQYRITMKGNCEITDFENDGNIDHVWCEFRMDASFKEKPLAVIDSRQLYNNLIISKMSSNEIIESVQIYLRYITMKPSRIKNKIKTLTMMILIIMKIDTSKIKKNLTIF